MRYFCFWSRALSARVVPSASENGLGKPWVEPSGFPVVGSGLVDIALRSIGRAAKVIRLSEFRVDLKGLAVVGDGIVEIALL
jgi:hypothetical protein